MNKSKNAAFKWFSLGFLSVFNIFGSVKLRDKMLDSAELGLSKGGFADDYKNITRDFSKVAGSDKFNK